MNLIKNAAELDIQQTVKVMIYGQSGMGKSTLALSAPKPLLIDFDNGVKRINDSNLKDVAIVQVKDWNDMKTLMSSVNDLAPYQSVVVDTIGKMMDYIIVYKCGTHQPTIRDWGGINQEFQWFTRSLSSLNKNIVFVAHRDTRKEGEDTIYIPALREKSYSAIVADLDLLGYMEMKNVNGMVKRTITFDPTNRNEGKNTCYMKPVMDIPTIIDASGNAIAPNDFILKEVIIPYTGMLEKKREERQAYDKLISEIEDAVASVSDAESAQFFSDHIKEYKHVGSSLQKAKSLFSSRLNVLGLVFNKQTKKYEPKDAAA